MTRIARCIVANYNSGITRFGESSGVMYCKACDEKCTQKCVEARARLTPDRLNKRQNGRRFKEDGEPEFTLTTIDRHGVMIFAVSVLYGTAYQRGYKERVCHGASWGWNQPVLSRQRLPQRQSGKTVFTDTSHWS